MDVTNGRSSNESPEEIYNRDLAEFYRQIGVHFKDMEFNIGKLKYEKEHQFNCWMTLKLKSKDQSVWEFMNMQAYGQCYEKTKVKLEKAYELFERGKKLELKKLLDEIKVKEREDFRKENEMNAEFNVKYQKYLNGDI